eukprot:602328-Rhodomonas_salina.1
MRSPVRLRSEVNVTRKLMQREVSRKANRTFHRSNAQEKFKYYELCVSLPSADARLRSASIISELCASWVL